MEGYSSWTDLDETRRYCLVDTMNTVDVYRDAPDVVDGVRDAVGERTLLVIPNVVAESAGVCKELSGRDWDDLKTLESDIMSGMTALGVPVEFARLPDDVLAAAVFKQANAKPANHDGARLSPVDCMLLCAVACAANVDVMTEDKALRDAVGAECGIDRACTARKKYQDRNARTAWFIGVVAGVGYVGWWTRNGRTEFHSGGVRVAVLEDAGGRWGAVRECSIGKPGAATAIEAFYRAALPDDCCRCSLEGIKALDCVCIYGDGIDGGLNKDSVRRFLRALPGHERKAVLARARSFGRGA